MASDLERLARLLWIVDEASMDAAILIEFRAGSELAGRVAAEHGRVFWAAARDQDTRMSDIFAREFGVSREELEETYRSAASRGRPFGEELVARRIVTEDILRRTLRQQTVAAITALNRQWDEAASGSWSSAVSPHDSYDVSYTLGTVELMIACVERSPKLRCQAGAPSTTFSRLASGRAGAICFLRTASPRIPAVPVAAANIDGLGMFGALMLGRDAVVVARPPALTAASIEPWGTLVHMDGEGVLCARDGPHLCVFEICGRDHYGEILAALIARSREA